MIKKISIPTILILTTIFLSFNALAQEIKEVNPSQIVKLEDIKKWFMLLDYDQYEQTITSDILNSFQMAILDSDNRPPIFELKKNIMLIAYVSIGEAEMARAYWPNIKWMPWVISQNPSWKNNYFVDVRSAEWRAIIINQVIQGVMDQGFKGILLDSLDSPVLLENVDSELYKGSRKAMIDFIAQIHERYPKLILLSSNGFSILEDIAPYLNGMVTEDLYAFEKNANSLNSKKERKRKMKILNAVKKKYHLPVFNIEYARLNNPESVRFDYAQCRKKGLNCYVGEKGLSRLILEHPKKQQ